VPNKSLSETSKKSEGLLSVKEASDRLKKPENAIDRYTGCCILQSDAIVDEGRKLFSEYYGREITTEEVHEIYKSITELAQELMDLNKSKEGDDGQRIICSGQL
jgi:hypothetical protein